MDIRKLNFCLMCLNTNLPKIRRTALVWHSCPLSTYLINRFGWIPIQTEKQFENTDFNLFDEVIFLAELSWDRIAHNDMMGIKLMLEVIQGIDLEKTSVQLLSFYSHKYLKKHSPNTYRQSIMLQKNERAIIPYLNVWNFKNISDQRRECILKNIFYGKSHGTNVLDMTVRFSTRIYHLKNNSTHHIKIGDTQFSNSFFKKIGQVKHNYVQIIKKEEDYFLKKITERFQLYSAVKLIQKLENLKHNQVSLRSFNKIEENLLLLKKHFTQLNNYLNQN